MVGHLSETQLLVGSGLLIFFGSSNSGVGKNEQLLPPTWRQDPTSSMTHHWRALKQTVIKFQEGNR